MPVPTNITPETALVIPSLPYSVTLDAFEVPSESLWFRYNKVVGGNTVLVMAAPDPLVTGTYVPRIDAYYADENGDLQPYLNILSINKPITTPIDSQIIISYYWEVQQVGGAFTEQLAFQAIPGPVAAAPAGSFVINDDTEGFPIAIVSSDSGAVLQSFPFPAGERAAVLASGVSAWHDQQNKRFGVYSPVFAHIATTVWADAVFATAYEAPMSATAATFFLGSRGEGGQNARVTTMDAAGALGATTWDLGSVGLRAIAPSLDATILYYIQDTTEAAIKRWDLVNDVALSDLAAGVASYTNGKDLLVMADGSIVAAYTAVVSPFVRRYSAAGATLNTYALANYPNRLAHAGDGTSFWVWTFPSAGVSRFTQYRASDGVVLATVDGPNATGGIWNGTNPLTPTEAHSTSCPFTLLPPPGLPPIVFAPPEPVYGTRVLVQRRLRRAPHISDEQKIIFYRQLQIDLQAGVGLNDGQGEDPQVMLRYSDDGGHTWSDIVTVSAGRMGKTRARAIYRNLGWSRDRVFEVTVSDPVSWYLIDAYLDVERGTN